MSPARLFALFISPAGVVERSLASVADPRRSLLTNWPQNYCEMLSKRKARDSNPHHHRVARVSSAARQSVSGYLP